MIERLVFRGTTATCMEAFLSKHNDPQDQRIIAELMQVSLHGTLKAWIRHGYKSRGEVQIKARTVLELFGYSCSEWDALSPEVRNIAYAIGLDVVSVSDACEALHYPNHQQLYVLLSDKQHDVVPERAELVVQYSRVVSNALATKLHKVHEMLCINSPGLWNAIPSAHEVGADTQAESSEPAPPVTKDLTVGVDIESVFVHTILAMLPLAQYLNGPDVSADTRRSVRKQLGHGVLGELNNLLEALSSEQHRTHWLEGQQEERIVR